MGDPDRASGRLATLTPPGGYKYDGDAAGEFRHVVGMTRFAPGELDPCLPEVRRSATGEPLRTTGPA